MRRWPAVVVWLSLVACTDEQDFIVRARAAPLPELPTMEHVVVVPGDHRVTIRFDAVPGAQDYRVYARPDPADVLVSAADPTRLVAVRGATYRCAGLHEAPPIQRDALPDPNDGSCRASAVLDSSQPDLAHCGADAMCRPTAGGTGNWFGDGGYVRQPSEVVLGWVYGSDGPDRVPVHVLADPDLAAYGDCPFHVWRASRNKIYSADPAAWSALVAAGWLDVGVAFYAPTAGDRRTVHVVALPSASPASERHFLFLDGPERDFRAGLGQSITDAFDVLAAPAPDTLPLERVLYTQEFSSYQHDELALGDVALADLYGQGTAQIRRELTFTWSGDPPAELVVEALDAGCPFEGWLADHALPAEAPFEAWTTIDAVRAADPFGEVFVNGQHEGATRPQPIARAFVTPVQVSRTADFLYRPGVDAESFVETTPTCDASNLQCDASTLHTLSSPSFDVTWNGVEGERYAIFPALGQLWTSHSDVGASVLSQLRLSARPAATMASDTFLYVTMDVSSVVSSARFPQILVDDRPDVPLWLLHRGAPGAGTGHTLLVEPTGEWPSEVRVEVCGEGPWPFPTPCPSFDLRRLDGARYAPVDEVAEQMGTDVVSRLEIYASTRSTYVFFDGRPYGCVDHDPATMPSGAARVTFGDVLIHSGADAQWLGPLAGGFRARHAQTIADRRFGELGFSSGVPAPSWDPGWPCVSVPH